MFLMSIITWKIKTVENAPIQKMRQNTAGLPHEIEDQIILLKTNSLEVTPLFK